MFRESICWVGGVGSKLSLLDDPGEKVEVEEGGGEVLVQLQEVPARNPPKLKQQL